MADELLVFNGVNGASGGYLLPPMTAQALGQAALGTRWQDDQFRELEDRHKKATEKRYALRAGLDPQKLAEAGWGVIFPGAWDAGVQQAVRGALWELLEYRQAQAGELYREYVGSDAPAPGESKDSFLRRFKAGPGLVDPTKVPYYLLLVGDPQSLSYEFQFELSVAYAVGRVYFENLEEYARYARSVVSAEKDGTERVRLRRRAVFFGPANANDPATQLSAELLLKPVSGYVKKQFPDWDVTLTPPQESTKNRLLDVLGGADTPALLFTASHGLGFPANDPRQRAFQGSLLCQDWPGPQDPPVLTRDMYVAAEDIGDQASLLGLIGFHFACFGAGTPQREFFGIPGARQAGVLAPRAFLGALPQRLLSHPRGGALAVVGHVDRAWSYSFQWGGEDPQTVTFESLLYRLLSGQTVGSALEDLSLRYAEFATLLSSRIYEAEITRPDLREMAQLWVAHNDARGYALLGDPAVRLPVQAAGQAAEQAAQQETQPRPAIAEVTGPQGRLPEPPGAEAAVTASSAPVEQAYTAPAESPAAQAALTPDERARLTEELQAAVTALTKISLLTYLLPDGQTVHSEQPLASPPEGAQLVAMTRLDGGKARTTLLQGDLDPAFITRHGEFAESAFRGLAEALRAAQELLERLQAGP
jgi:hypothetical protein